MKKTIKKYFALVAMIAFAAVGITSCGGSGSANEADEIPVDGGKVFNLQFNAGSVANVVDDELTIEPICSIKTCNLTSTCHLDITS